MLDEGRQVGAVLALPIECHRAVSRRVGDEHGALRLDGGEAPADGAPLFAGLAHPRHERIVAAGIEDDELHLAGAGDLGQQTRQRHRLILDVALLLQSGIDGDADSWCRRPRCRGRRNR